MILIKTHGGKFRIKHKILEQFPPNYQKLNYCEPFAGGASILLNKEPSIKDVYNDLDWWTYNLFRQVQLHPKVFKQELLSFAYSEENFLKFLKIKEENKANKLTLAVAEYSIRRMSRGGLGKSFAWSDRLRGGKPGDVNAWEQAIKNIVVISKRLRDVNIMNLDGLSVILGCNGPRWLIYEDPPYVLSTRKTKAYTYEMTDNDHEELAKRNNNSKALILISGYNSSLYNRLYRGWNKVEFKVKNNAGQNKVKKERIECIWRNY